jgi:hypothetical protein
VKTPTGEIHVGWARCLIENAKLTPDFLDVAWVQTALISLPPEALKCL